MKASSRSWLGARDRRRRCSGWPRSRLQCVEYTVQHFGPDRRRLRERVLRLDARFYLIAVLCTMYWLETQVATELRARRAPAPSEGDIKDADRLIAPGAGRRRLLLGVPRRDRRRDLRDAVPALMLAAAAATPGFWDWSFDPPLVLVIDLRDPLLARRPAHRHAARASAARSAGASVCFYAAPGWCSRSRSTRRSTRSASSSSGCTWSSTCCCSSSRRR